MKTAKTTKVQYRDPGIGAIEFTRQFIVGLARHEAEATIERLLKGELHDRADKRVKRCDYCGYYWRDDSLRNTKKTCCDECKTGIKTLQKRQQRADKALLNPKQNRKTKVDDYYIWWLEYPFWLNEREMVNYHRRMESSYSTRKLEIIDAARQRDEIIGGKIKRKIGGADAQWGGDTGDED